MSETVNIYFDGGCKPKNPGGIACFGLSIRVDDKEIKTVKGTINPNLGTSNNVAEYEAMYQALCFLLSRPDGDSIKVYGDSKLVIEQMRGNWKVNGGLYFSRYKECKRLLDSLHVLKPKMEIEFKWIPREKNARADELCNRAYDEHVQRGGNPF